MRRYNWLQHGKKLLGKGGSEALATWRDMLPEVRLDPPLDMLRRVFQGGLTDCMLEHLWAHRNRKCGNDKDRIFAMRALCTEPECSSIIVDYSSTVEAIFVQITRDIITSSGSLNILGTCLPLERKYPSLPSSVTDWSNSEARRPMRLFISVTTRIQGVPYAALPGTTASVHALRRDAKGVLAINGYHAQTISHISQDRAE